MRGTPLEVKRITLSPVNTAEVRAVRRQHSRSLAAAPELEVLAFVRSRLATGHWADRVIAYEVLAEHAAAFARLDDALAAEMAEGWSDWASVDLYGVTVLGQAWREGLVSDALILSWTRSEDRWMRRLALVATVPLNSRARGAKGEADPRRTLRICRALVDDRDDMVVKALSWALRELVKRDVASVTAFLEQEDARVAPRVKREVRNKLTTGLKSGRKRR